MSISISRNRIRRNDALDTAYAQLVCVLGHNVDRRRFSDSFDYFRKRSCAGSLWRGLASFADVYEKSARGGGIAIVGIAWGKEGRREGARKGGETVSFEGKTRGTRTEKTERNVASI